MGLSPKRNLTLPRSLRRLLFEQLEARLPQAGLPVPASFQIAYTGGAIQYPSAVYSFPARDLSTADGIGLEVFNQSNVIARVGITIQSLESNGTTIALYNIQPLQHVKLAGVFSNDAKVFGLPFTDPAVTWMHPLAINADPSNVTGLTFFLDRPTAATKVTISNVRLLGHISLNQPLIDEFGQYTRKEWEGKAHSEDELTQLIKQDLQKRSSTPALENRDSYGGLLNSGVTFNRATFIGTPGHFRAAKDLSGRWWLVTPLNNPFYAVGVNSVQPYSGSPIAGREQLFEPIGPLTPQGSFDFYAENIDRYDAIEGDDASWQARTINRLLSWGFNSLGNWSDGTLTQPVNGAPRIPYMRTVLQQRLRLMPQTRFDGGAMTPTLAFPGTNLPVPVFYTNGGRYAFPDVFTQVFRDYVTQTRVTASGVTVPGFFGTPEVARTNSDPFAIGFFVDNEIRWSGGERDEFVALPRAALNKTGSLVRQRFLQELAKKYPSAGNLANAWGISFSPPLANPNGTPLAALGSQLFVFPDQLNATAKADLNRLLGIYADQYYRLVRDGFKAHLPNKLYLGSRLYEGSAPESVLKAAAKYVDVMSINLYRKPIDVGRIDWAPFATLNKPLLVGEFGYVATDQGHFTGFHENRDVASQEEKGSLYQKYMDLIARNPLFVGASVFTYVDEVASGRGGNYENLNVGLVDILDLPHQEYVERVSAWNQHSYETRLKRLPANHAPVLNTGVASNLTPIQQGNRFSYGTPVWQLLGGVTDADPAAERGIAVTWLSHRTSGNWQYTLDGGRSWYDFPGVSASSARLLPAAGSFSRVRFQPNASFTGTVKIGFYAWDQKQGNTRGTFNLSGSGKLGGNKAFSTGYRSSSLLVTAAPIINLSGTLGYARNAPPALVASTATLVDTLRSTYLGWQLKVQITSGFNAADRLTIRAPFTVSNGNVLLSGVTIGKLTSGSSATPLTVNLNQNATRDRLQKLLRAVAFSTTTQSGPRSVAFTLGDGSQLSPAAVRLVNVT